MAATHSSRGLTRMPSYFSKFTGSSSSPTSVTPRSMRSFTCSAVAVYSSKRTRGYSARKERSSSGSSSTAPKSPQPKATVPSMEPFCSASSRSVLSTSSRISSARRRSSRPSVVRESRRVPRAKSFTPSSSSAWAICRLRVGWVMCSTSAAFVMLSCWATAKKYRRNWTSIAMPPFFVS